MGERFELRVEPTLDDADLPLVEYRYRDGATTWRRDHEPPERGNWVGRTVFPHARITLIANAPTPDVEGMT